MKKKTGITLQRVWRRGQIFVGTSKGTVFVIVTKFGSHALRHLASRLANVVRQGGRQPKNLVLAIFFKNPYLSFYNCCIVLCTISGFSNVKAEVLFVA